MSTSTLKFYKNTPILPNKNFMVDDISAYLKLVFPANKFTITDFQYIKHSLNLEIKIDSEQTDLEFLLDNGWNYMSIQNSDTNAKVVYYFIVNKEWKAQNTIKMTLYMDTINTFKYGVDYILSDKTKVMREHKDRFRRYYSNNWEVFQSKTEYYNGHPDMYVYSSTPSANGYLYRVWIIKAISSSYSLDVDRWRLNFEPSPTIVGGHDSMKLLDYSVEDSGFFLTIFGNFNELNYLIFSLTLEYNNITKEPYLLRNVDYFDEGLHPILYKKMEEEIHQNEEIDISWNFVYKGSSKVDCYLVPEQPQIAEVIISEDELTIGYGTFSEGETKLFMYGYNDGEILRDMDEVYTTISKVIIEVNGKEYNPYYNSSIGWRRQHFGYAFKRPSGQNYLELYAVSWEYSRWGDFWKHTETLITTNIPSFKLIRPLDKTWIYQTNGTIPNNYTDANNYYSYSPSTTKVVELYGINQIDRTESTLIKIIKSPYLPSDFSVGSNNRHLFLDSEYWEYDNQYNEYKLIGNDTDLTTTIVSHASSFFNDLILPIDYFKCYNIDSASGNITGVNITTLRDIYFESKLFHSSFYQRKFVYDSFAFLFQNEKIDIEESIHAHEEYSGYEFKYTLNDNKLLFDFSISKTINSKFLFMFPDYKLKMSEEDYDNVLPIARNNEMVIYNSEYINYLKSAYNYDLKARERTEKLAGIQFGIKTGVGALTSLITTIVNVPAGLMSWAGTFASTLAGITELTNTMAQAEDSVERKIASMKAQAVSVNGADDIDLLTQYSNNRAKQCIYEVSDRVKNMLFDLFYYTGYGTGEMKVPSLTTRIWFNFIQADIVIKENKANIPQSLLDNIAERFKGGLTNLHYNLMEVVGIPDRLPVWDFDQKYENWESGLLDDINS